MTEPRMVIDLLLFAGSVFMLWQAYRSRGRLAAWKALVQQYRHLLSERSGMLDTALDLATKQKQRITALEAELDGRQ